MKKRILFVATILLLCSSVARAVDIDDGVKAYDEGNYVQALELLQPLAAQGNGSAQFYLGLMYDKGEGVTQDYKEAAKWYRLSAKQGHAYAQYNLGAMYAKGEGVTQDYKEAVKWYRLAAAQGDAYAQNNLGAMYAKGEGVTQDYVHAHIWFSFAASKGYKKGSENRENVTKKMTPSQIADAEKMARDCVKKDYKNCE